ncbi:LOW QUALITY PROTEIN: hypothetical protein PHMEG_00022962 [Phytophthora megakarya]|uniref:Reverse transcriptase RNase H-like domain-containing protein n=1 Tax=Phytophthora megakarya TaxID=4795 RepID=A0A225VHY4_9STRA|nr:LOW QUALITY PROTEIN: hypothetical protein PHMEG_00022962 [Phytophthora megakarya]
MAKETAGRLHRWALTLQEYDFTIEYRPGRENQDQQQVMQKRRKQTPQMIWPLDPNNLQTTPTITQAITIIVHEAEAVIRIAQVQRVEAAELGIVQFTDENVQFTDEDVQFTDEDVQFTDEDEEREQSTSNMVQRLNRKGSYRGKRVYEDADRPLKVDIGDGESRMI